MSAGWVLRHVERLQREPWSHYRAELLERAAELEPAESEAERKRLTLPFLGWGRPEVQRAEIQAVLHGLANREATPWQPSSELAGGPRVAKSAEQILAFLTPPSG